ncbi:structural cement protein Gp24 [Phenylobacterium sp.]|uniref:structural cement protein Gp24 n=1 Tax=Phenylobacterium sp. TaxID=1871053 RepID=UPI003001430D
MAVNQDTYADNLAAGYAGMVANGETSNRISRTCEDSGGIGFGVPVYRGSGDHGCTRTPGGQFLGITIAHEALGLLSGQTADEYAQYDDVAIMTQGVIWVTAGEAVTDGAQAYDSDTAIVDTSTDNTILTGWFFDTTGANGALVKLAKR